MTDAAILATSGHGSSARLTIPCDDAIITHYDAITIHDVITTHYDVITTHYDATTNIMTQ